VADVPHLILLVLVCLTITSGQTASIFSTWWQSSYVWIPRKQRTSQPSFLHTSPKNFRTVTQNIPFLLFSVS
jgi:hypothetical protein